VRPGSLPISQLILWDLIVPPIIAVLWRITAGGWAMGVQRGDVSEKTRQRQWTEFWAILVLTFLVLFGFTIYSWLS
jgi:hypothetical protein